MSDTDISILKILLVDDNIHDCYFFQEALNQLPIPSILSSTDGEGLMSFLADNTYIPDVLFLDLNMPCKNGFECLTELKLDKTLQHIPVIIYSTAFDEMVANELHKMGAYSFVEKTDLITLKDVLFVILTTIKEEKLNIT